MRSLRLNDASKILSENIFSYLFTFNCTRNCYESADDVQIVRIHLDECSPSFKLYKLILVSATAPHIIKFQLFNDLNCKFDIYSTHHVEDHYAVPLAFTKLNLTAVTNENQSALLAHVIRQVGVSSVYYVTVDVVDTVFMRFPNGDEHTPETQANKFATQLSDAFFIDNDRLKVFIKSQNVLVRQ